MSDFLAMFVSTGFQSPAMEVLYDVNLLCISNMTWKMLLWIAIVFHISFLSLCAAISMMDVLWIFFMNE